mgnify:CR=1 FL=1
MWGKITENSIEPYINKEITMEEAYEELRKPITEFLLKQTREADLELFVKGSWMSWSYARTWS